MAAYLITVVRRDNPSAPQQLFLLEGDLELAQVGRLAVELLYDPLVQTVHWGSLDQSNVDADCVEIAFKPGVTDNLAESVKVGAARLGIDDVRVVRTMRRHHLPPTGDRTAVIAGLYNPVIEMALDEAQLAERHAFYQTVLKVPADISALINQVPLREAEDDELQRISRAGILALDLNEMSAIREYFRQEGRDPTDGELETLAQTWSEHCSHKTFKARVRYQSNTGQQALDPQHYAAYQLLGEDAEINSLIHTFLMTATQRVLAQVPENEWVLSAFVDNAGIIAFGVEHEVSFKVETHNHPSALEPFGGANTGIGGVVRDVLGVSAKPIANTNVLCFGPLGATDVPAGVLPPAVIAAGVVAGVRDYGNKLGIATVNGAVLYDQGYTANPLVFCGTVGLAPRGRHPRGARPGDVVVVLGGRTGRDGIHGATFSSEELTHTTVQDVGSAVQIGDPITEKKLIDVIVQARDLGLYSAITDCGAGGLSSAIGEMGEATGVRVALEDAPLKYAGLQPWEIWLSEAQERMVLAVPPEQLAALLALCAAEDVEATALGAFTDDQRLSVTYHGAPLVDLSMEFTHHGMPQRVLHAAWAAPTTPSTPTSAAAPDIQAIVLRLLAHPNIASKEPIVRTYDHEVGGRTVVKPLVGVGRDGPGDAAVLQPLPASYEGIAIGCGINPRYGLLDPYWMALACVDEALRNVVAVGGDPTRTVILDNFCWGDPRQPDRMAGLVRAAAGCYDAALAYGAPFISGKDSLNNEYRAADGSRTPIPPTLLISALAHVLDVRRAVTMDLKEVGNQLFLVGVTKPELGGAHAYDCGLASSGDDALPAVDLATAPRILGAIHHAMQHGLVRACHDVSEGGLAVAAAEMAFAGGLGLQLDLAAVPHSSGAANDAILLFAESPTRLLLEVRSSDSARFAELFDGLPCAMIGEVTEAAEVVVSGLTGAVVLCATLAELKAAWQATKVV